MRRFFLLGLITAGLLLGSTIVKATTRSTVPDALTQEYWMGAQKLTKEQVQLLSRVETALPGKDAQRLKVLRGQLLLHISAVDRFIKANDPNPQQVCIPSAAIEGSIAGTDAVSLEEAQVYCALYGSIRDLNVLRSRLDQRSKLLTQTTGVSKKTIRVARTPVKVAKTARATMSLASSSQEIRSLLASSRLRLVQMQPAFPVSMQVEVPGGQALPLPRQVGDASVR